MFNQFEFKVLKKDKLSHARLGELHTPHGVIQTPNFIFCATRAALKGLSMKEVKEVGAQIVLSNTYHLMLRPGDKLIAKMGGLQKFTNWNGPMLTDSGGYQVFSLGHGGVSQEIKGARTLKFDENNKLLLKIEEEGVTFRSYFDGSKHLLTPEKAIEIQRNLGADLIVAFDECTPYRVDKNYTRQSLLMTQRWAKRCINSFNDESIYPAQTGSAGPQALYGVLQGGIYHDLRQEGADFLNQQEGFFAQAVGGCLGDSKPQMHEIVSVSMEALRRDRPTHLLGIGDIDDIWHGILQGIDTFDCVSPTRLARHGWALCRWAPNYRLNLKNACYKEDERELDPETQSYASQFSRAYFHHLFKVGETLGTELLAIHNARVMMRLMEDIRESIANDTVLERKKWWTEDKTPPSGFES